MVHPNLVGAHTPGAVVIVSGRRALLFSVALLLAAQVFGTFAYKLVWPGAPPGDGWLLPALIVLGIPCHEALHGLAMVLAGVPAKRVRFGAKLARGLLFATTDVPLTAARYAFVLVLPSVVLGLVPFAAALMSGSFDLLLFAGVMIAGAGGDLAIAMKVFERPSASLVRDHPSEMGFLVLGEAPDA